LATVNNIIPFETPLIPSTCNAVQELKCADVLAKLLRLWPKAGNRQRPTNSRPLPKMPRILSLPVAAPLPEGRWHG